MNNGPKPRNESLTQCISDLAARAGEIGEKETATVLYALAAHRVMMCDYAMALVSSQQAAILKAAVEQEQKGENK